MGSNNLKIYRHPQVKSIGGTQNNVEGVVPLLTAAAYVAGAAVGAAVAKSALGVTEVYKAKALLPISVSLPR